jgi:MoaA/NifB/PqqE/SkfB family radical SAM enzyme
MNRAIRILDNIRQGIPYFVKEMESLVSSKTPFFISRPRVIYVIFDGPCNGRCVMCPVGNQNTQEITKKQVPKTPEDVLIRRLREMRKLTGPGLLVSFICGEPLLYKPLFSIMEACRECGIDFSFTTNGYLLTQETVEKIGRMDPFNIGVSLESITPEVNEALRPMKNGTRKTLDGIDMLLVERAKHGRRYSINIKCTLTQLNYREIIPIVKQFGKRDGVFVTPQPFEIQDGVPREMVDKLLIKDPQDFEQVMLEVIDLKKYGYSVNADRHNLRNFVNQVKTKPEDNNTVVNVGLYGKGKECTIGNTHLFIWDTGDACFCTFMKPIGNINSEQSLQDMWYGVTANKLREQVAKCQRVCNYSCTRSSLLWDKIVLFLRR